MAAFILTSVFLFALLAITHLVEAVFEPQYRAVNGICFVFYAALVINGLFLLTRG